MAASKELTDDVRLAHLMADDADSLSMNRFKARDLHFTAKPDNTPVSEADTAVEESIRRRLARTRPRDAVHGEEFADTGQSSRRWIIDPIDGTRNFASGSPDFAVMVAEVRSGVTTRGWIWQPMHHRMYVAELGSGVRLNEGSPAKSAGCRIGGNNS